MLEVLPILLPMEETNSYARWAEVQAAIIPRQQRLPVRAPETWFYRMIRRQSNREVNRTRK